jgi:arylsulfatase A-like enzyme
MRKTRRIFSDGGVRYPHAFATTPVCCPSRATIFTGRYAHNHGLLSQTEGEMDNLDTGTTIPYHLQQAGYRTAVFGKYFSLWPIEESPDYFDEWVTAHGVEYDELTWNVRGDLKLLQEYGTTLIGDYATEFIERLEDSSQPWFVLIGTKGSHAPFTPDAKYSSVQFPVWDGNPAVSEGDRGDKPPYVRQTKVTLRRGRRLRTHQFRTLLSTDDLVGRVFETLRATQQDTKTLAFFVSDNGYLWGEHGLHGKNVPYTGSVRVPMLARWPGHLPAGKEDTRLVGNVDITPTILDATGIDPNPSVPLDGRSLLDSSWTRNRILLEHWCSSLRCTYWSSTRTKTDQYIETYDERGNLLFQEYYDLKRDPWQLTNLLHDGETGNDPDVAALHDRIEADRACVGTSGAAACP